MPREQDPHPLVGLGVGSLRNGDDDGTAAARFTSLSVARLWPHRRVPEAHAQANPDQIRLLIHA